MLFHEISTARGIGLFQKPSDNASRTHCLRCGECCLKASPTLQKKDLHLIRRGAIGKKDLFTIRKGELVRDNIAETLVIAGEEMIKLREREGGCCVLYDAAEKACKIYEERPLQCSALKCWDPSEFMKVYEGPKLQRRDVAEGMLLLDLITEHEARCSYERLEGYMKEIEGEGEKAIQEIIDLLNFDFQLRPFISDKLQIDPEEMAFLFGRPLVDTVPMFGLKVSREADGTFFLSPLENHIR